MTNHDPRDLEWQRRYEQNDTPWDKGAPAPALVRFLNENAIAGQILVPGCGKGHEVRALGLESGCTVIGLDLSETALAEARQLAVQAGTGANVSFIAGDFFHLPSERNGSFDWLVEHTCFCAIDPDRRSDYVRAAAAALRTGGKIFGIFYLNPDVENGPPFGVSKKELTRLFSPDFALLEEWAPEETFPGRENREWIRILQKRRPFPP